MEPGSDVAVDYHHELRSMQASRASATSVVAGQWPILSDKGGIGRRRVAWGGTLRESRALFGRWGDGAITSRLKPFNRAVTLLTHPSADPNTRGELPSFQAFKRSQRAVSNTRR
ncbi:unnamed protein product [Cutaneotrichosporon oleaginosum]